MSTSKKAFKGGYRFRNFKGTPLSTIVQVDAPASVTIPLQQGYGAAANAIVKVGDTVKAGQIIGKNPDVVSSPIHASVTGRVTDLPNLVIGTRGVPAVTIEKSEGFSAVPEQIQRLSGCESDWKRLQADRISELIYQSGAASLDSSGIPTKFGSSEVAPEEIDHVIVQAVEDELLAASANVLLEGDALRKFSEGCMMLKRILPKADLTIAVSKNNRALAKNLANVIQDGDEIDIVSVSDKFPQSRDEVLVPTIFGGGFPYGFRAVNIGVVVVSVQTVLHVYDAVTEGLPVTTRVVALGGTGFTENVSIRVPIGTSGVDILTLYGRKDGEFRYVCNSLLTGSTIADPSLPVTRTCSAIYAISEAHSTELMSFATPGFSKDSYSNTFPTALIPVQKKLDTNIHGEERACLSCSFCAEVCPVGIQPNLLHRYVQRDIVDESLQQFRILDCIDCNLCTYVCPSKIPVAGLIKQGKDRLRAEGLSDDQKIKNEFILKGIE